MSGFMVPMCVRKLEVEALHEPPFDSSRGHEALIKCGVPMPNCRFKAPMRVRNSEVAALHEPALTRPCGHPLPSHGRGAGGEGSFACRFMAPIRVHKQVFALHEPPPALN